MEKFLTIHKNNNLNSIKLVCALLVIFHHSYPITMGQHYIDPFRRFTNLQFSFGNFSVIIFLFIAGMLITKSYLNSDGNIQFLLKRLKRLLPSLIIVIFITVFIIGPIFTSMELAHYFITLDVYKYLFMNCILLTNHNLPIFLDNAYNLSPNGALWTLPVEFLCYVGCVILGSLSLLKKNIMKYLPYLVIFINLLQFIFIDYISGLWPAIQAILFFLMGMAVYFNKERIKLCPKYFILSLCITIISLICNLYSYINIITIPYMVIFLAFYFNKKVKFLDRLGNYSYEIYLVGFLIQQCVAYIIPMKVPYLNFIISVPIVFLLAIIINKLVDFIDKKILVVF